MGETPTFAIKLELSAHFSHIGSIILHIFKQNFPCLPEGNRSSL